MSKAHPTRLYHEPEEIQQLFNQYKDWVSKNPFLVHDFVGKDAKEVHKRKQRPITLDGFCTWHYNTVGGNIEQYFTNQDGYYTNFIGICRAIKQEIRAHQIAGGMANIYNPSITARLNNLTEKQEVVSTDKGKNLPKWMIEE